MICQKSQGFILPLAVIIIFSISTILTQLMVRSTALIPAQAFMAEREQAKQLALMGVTVVQAQLMLLFKKDEDKKEFYNQLLMVLNRWQQFTLKEEIDGVDGTLDIYISCENGKIPLNALWKFKEKKFIAPPDGIDVKKLLAGILFSGTAGKDQQVTESLERFLSTQQEPLEDLTQTFTETKIKEIAASWLPKPPTKEEQAKAADKQAIFYGDFFTVAHNDLKLQPLFLSAGVREMLGIKKLPSDEKEREQVIKNMTQSLKDQANWQQEWNGLLGKPYGVQYEALPEDAKKLFDNQIGASLISVVSYGKVGSVTEKLLALLASSKDDDGRVTYTIRKLYWL